MIRRIRRRFIRIALMVLALAMVLVAAVINGANWLNVRGELTETLSTLAESGGNNGRVFGGRRKRSRGLQNRLDESRFFSVMVDSDGECYMNDSSREAGASAEELIAVARRALDSGRSSGFSEDYLYVVRMQSDGRSMAVFLNCETRLDAVRRLALISAVACVAGILLAWLLVALFSNRAIQPMIENAERQKRFITDAGHELKTPLTVISANMDVLLLETGENEWVRSTQKQVANLRGLVNELIYLSRLDEEDAGLQWAPFSLTEAVREASEPFEGMAEFKGKTLRRTLGADVRMRGDEGAIKRLVSVLCDNAVKYAPQEDVIALKLKADGKRAVLTVENGLTAPMEPEALKHLFDRFYRADASRSKENGGYGIGLSVARAILEKHGGSIRVKQTEDNRLRFVASVPLSGRRHDNRNTGSRSVKP